MSSKTNIIVGFCLDETGSMAACRDSTVSGFNEFIDDQAKQPGNTKLSLTLFSDMGGSEPTFRFRHDAEPIKDVPHITVENYVPRGITPLYDAIGQTVRKVEQWLGDQKGKWSVVFVIQTDGHENASREYSRERIFSLIQEKENDDWRFIYLGANQDEYAAENAAVTMGMAAGSSTSYSYLQQDAALQSLSTTVSAHRRSGGTLTSAQLAAVQKKATADATAKPPKTSRDTSQPNF